MSLLSLCDISFEYSSASRLFEGVTFSVNPLDRVAIVGPNGAGKTTLLRLISGTLEPVGGRIVRRSPLRLATADQEIHAGSSRFLFDFAFEAFGGLAVQRAAMHEMESRLDDPACACEYSVRVNEYQEAGGFAAEAAVARTLSGLGYLQSDYDRDIRTLSGGERNRAALARALSARSDLLILDEPTNHLDIAAREWLEGELRSRPASCIFTSHDRTLLDRVATRIVEIERGKVRVFETGYREYRGTRKLLERQAWQAYDASERRRAAAEEASRRRAQLARKVATPPAGERTDNDFYNRKAAKVARTARILRERASEDKCVDKPWEEQPIDGLSFEHVARCGDVAIQARGLAKSWGGRTLFHDLTFVARRGDRLAIRGPNGSGKTTLLSIIRGAVASDEGWVRLGSNVRLEAVAQVPADLDLDRTPLELCGVDTNARTLLACLKLRPERLNSPLRSLSGGERTKVALARILNSGANLLLLDEPTNHLEIEAQEALEQALARYPGTLIVVSHDRSFLEALGPGLAYIDL